MHRYQVGEKLGDGTYGEVLRATNKSSGEIVAIKRFRTRPSCPSPRFSPASREPLSPHARSLPPRAG